MIYKQQGFTLIEPIVAVLLIGSVSNPPVQSVVKCGDKNDDNNLRDGIEDNDHFDD